MNHNYEKPIWSFLEFRNQRFLQLIQMIYENHFVYYIFQDQTHKKGLKRTKNVSLSFNIE